MLLNKCIPCLKNKKDEVITKLDYSNSVLADAFPNVWLYERTLEELYLSSTRINTLPPQLFYCQSLRILAVNNNNLEALPNAIGSLRQLQHLSLTRNFISNVPDTIKTCKNLTHLDLSYNNIQRLPDAITSLITLQELLLNETYLEFLPANFGRLVNLKILELRLNNLIALPKSIARLCNLQRIDIGANEFTELPEVVGELKQLRELWIDFNKIRRISPNVAKLRELQHFEADANLIEALPSEISQWRSIEALSFCTNNLERLPIEIATMKYLITLKCESCELRELPDSISSLESLEELVVSYNRLLRLPSTIGKLRKLRFLFVDGNELCALPPELCSCSSLSVLSVSRNRLTELPQQIGHLNELKVLNLVYNDIATLPVSILRLINLISLWISDNQSQPLVPLQFVDNKIRTQLTCFMLPQTGTATLHQQQKIHTNSSETEDHLSKEFNGNNYDLVGVVGAADSYAEVTKLKQQQHLCKSLTNCQNNSPTKRICFAEETTILSGSSSSVYNCSDDDATVTKNITTGNTEADQRMLGMRLLRSPTPYPKELRLMAKYVRYGQKSSWQPQNQNVDTTAAKITPKIPLNDVKEARVVLNTSSVSPYNTLTYFDKNNSLRNNGNVETASNMLQQLSGDNNSAIMYASITSQKDLKQQKQQSLYSMQRSFDQMPYVLQQEDKKSLSTTAYCMPVEKFQHQRNKIPAGLSHPFLHDTKNGHQQKIKFLQDDKVTLQQQYKLQYVAPPPYDVAKVFTKKSPEDLNRYETLHQHKLLTNPQVLDNCQEQVSEQSENSVFIMQDLNRNYPKNTTVQFNFQSDLIEENNLLNRHPHQLEDEPTFCGGNNRFNTSEKKSDLWQRSHESQTSLTTSPNSAAKSKRWIFGVHKNPTVKQITLKWENKTDFDITEIPNKEGIYVASTISDTPAAHSLYIHDKLLELDGYDLTNMSLHEARAILLNAGPLMQIMLSRK